MSRLRAAMIGALLLSGTAADAQTHDTAPMAGMSVYIRQWGVSDAGMHKVILGSYAFALFPYDMAPPKGYMIPERTSDQTRTSAMIVTPEPSTTAMLAAGLIVFGIALRYRVRRTRAAQQLLAQRLR